MSRKIIGRRLRRYVLSGDFQAQLRPAKLAVIPGHLRQDSDHDVAAVLNCRLRDLFSMALKRPGEGHQPVHDEWEDELMHRG
jgi:hypothetical protein